MDGGEQGGVLLPRTGGAVGGESALALFQHALLELENAVLAGNMEECTKLYNALKDAQDKGHERFTND